MENACCQGLYGIRSVLLLEPLLCLLCIAYVSSLQCRCNFWFVGWIMCMKGHIVIVGCVNTNMNLCHCHAWPSSCSIHFQQHSSMSEMISGPEIVALRPCFIGIELQSQLAMELPLRYAMMLSFVDRMYLTQSMQDNFLNDTTVGGMPTTMADFDFVRQVSLE